MNHTTPARHGGGGARSKAPVSGRAVDVELRMGSDGQIEVGEATQLRIVAVAKQVLADQRSARPSYDLRMAFDEGLAERIRELTADEPGMSERKMFGGLAFLHEGNMCFGVLGSELMVRVGPDAYESALSLPHAREMDFTGRSMRGLVYVAEAGIGEDEELRAWLDRGLDFAGSLPPK